MYLLLASRFIYLSTCLFICSCVHIHVKIKTEPSTLETSPFIYFPVYLSVYRPINRSIYLFTTSKHSTRHSTATLVCQSAYPYQSPINQSVSLSNEAQCQTQTHLPVNISVCGSNNHQSIYLSTYLHSSTLPDSHKRTWDQSV